MSAEETLISWMLPSDSVRRVAPVRRTFKEDLKKLPGKEVLSLADYRFFLRHVKHNLDVLNQGIARIQMTKERRPRVMSTHDVLALILDKSGYGVGKKGL